MNATDLVDRANLREDIPDFAPGDTLKVHVRVVEGNRERTQMFQGVVIRRKGSGAARRSPSARSASASASSALSPSTRRSWPGSRS